MLVDGWVERTRQAGPDGFGMGCGVRDTEELGLLVWYSQPQDPKENRGSGGVMKELQRLVCWELAVLWV